MDPSGPEPAVPHGPVPALEDLYDEQVLARIDGAPGRTTPGPARPSPVPSEPAAPPTDDVGPVAAEPGTFERGPSSLGGTGGDGRPVIPRYPVARRVGGALLAGAMLGVADVIEPERARHHIIDFVPDVPDEDDQLVTFHHVPGDPQASRIVVRPWLLERFRARRG
jgi:hypothetical protein